MWIIAFTSPLFYLRSHFVSFPVQKPTDVTGFFSQILLSEPFSVWPSWQAKEHSDPYRLPLVHCNHPPAGAFNLGRHRTTSRRWPKSKISTIIRISERKFVLFFLLSIHLSLYWSFPGHVLFSSKFKTTNISKVLISSNIRSSKNLTSYKV